MQRPEGQSYSYNLPVAPNLTKLAGYDIHGKTLKAIILPLDTSCKVQ